MADLEPKVVQLPDVEPTKEEADTPADWLSGAKWYREYASEKPEPARMLLEMDGAGFMPQGKVAILAAPGGSGKTALATQLALSIATGHPFLKNAIPANAGPVAMLLGEEDETEVHRRLHGAADAMKLTAKDENGADDVGELVRAGKNLLTLPLAGLSVRLAGQSQGEEVEKRLDDLCARLEAEIEAHKADGWSAIIVDPLSRFGGVEMEISASEATDTVIALERLTKLPGNPTVICVHHTRKSGSKDHVAVDSVRGHSALKDAARWVAVINSADGDEQTLEYNPNVPPKFTLRVVKSNYTATGPTLHYELRKGVAYPTSSIKADTPKEPGFL